MKNKKIILIFIITFIFIFITGSVVLNYVKKIKKNEKNNEIIPEEEISDNQLRETIVTLYFVDKELDVLKPEGRLVNVKDILNSPYNFLLQLLIDGPKNEKLKKIIPEETKLLNVKLENDLLILDFSEDFLKYNNENEKNNIIYSIVNTLTELKEVNRIKIIINGNDSDEFKESYIRKNN